MLIRKPRLNEERYHLAPSIIPACPPVVTPVQIARDVELTSLELDDGDDLDCDPYNRTGQFCVIKKAN